MTETTQKKISKTTKILASAILIVVALVSVALITLSNTTTSYCMNIEMPNRIVIYKNQFATNKVFESDTPQFKQIYSAVLESYEQSTLNAITSGKIFKDVEIVESEQTEINFNGVTINFVYDTPQAVKSKNTSYVYNGDCYWYKSLIFKISDSGWQKNQVAIISVENSNALPMYYTLSYKAYSNQNEVFKIVSNMF